MQAVSEPEKSVSGCALMLGGGTVSTYCKGQAVIKLGSSEAVYCGLVSVTSQMLGLQSMGMEIQCPCVDGRQSWNCDWEPPRAQTSETHRHCVPVGARNGH